jgi:hypothetical protein
MSSISSLMAASSSSRVFAGFFKCPSLSGAGETGPPPLAIRYRRRPQTAGGGPTSQRLCWDNVPTAGCFAAAAASHDGSIASVYLRPCGPGDRLHRWHPRQ